MFKLVKKSVATKENCLMTGIISTVVGVGVGLAYLIKARSFDKNNTVIMAEYTVVE